MFIMNHRLTLITEELHSTVDHQTKNDRFGDSKGTERKRQPRHNAPLASFTATVLLMCLLAVVTRPAIAREFDHTHTVYDGIAKEFVQKGEFNYTGINANLMPLNLYLTQLGRVAEKDFNLWKETQSSTWTMTGR